MSERDTKLVGVPLTGAYMTGLNTLCEHTFRSKASQSRLFLELILDAVQPTASTSAEEVRQRMNDVLAFLENYRPNGDA